jgi:hypothetical protein
MGEAANDKYSNLLNVNNAGSRKEREVKSAQSTQRKTNIFALFANPLRPSREPALCHFQKVPGGPGGYSQ